MCVFLQLGGGAGEPNGIFCNTKQDRYTNPITLFIALCRLLKTYPREFARGVQYLFKVCSSNMFDTIFVVHTLTHTNWCRRRLTLKYIYVYRLVHCTQLMQVFIFSKFYIFVLLLTKFSTAFTLFFLWRNFLKQFWNRFNFAHLSIYAWSCSSATKWTVCQQRRDVNETANGRCCWPPQNGPESEFYQQF